MFTEDTLLELSDFSTHLPKNGDDFAVSDSLREERYGRDKALLESEQSQLLERERALESALEDFEGEKAELGQY